MTTRVLQMDLVEEPRDVSGLDGYSGARVLLRYGRRVLGQVHVPVEDGVMRAATVVAEMNEDKRMRERLCELAVDDVLVRPAPAEHSPSWSIIVCTRDRPEMVRRCIESLIPECHDGGEIIIVDNGPSTDETERVAAEYAVRYIREALPGLNRARATGARAARGDIVIYTDDDTLAEPGWVRAIVSEFSGARVGAVTGLTFPLELETDAQELFELYGGFGKGFDRRVFDVTTISPTNAGAVGSGASMAFRRELVVGMGLFDVELDLGTASITGGDTYGLYRVLARGYRVVYTPDALNWHQHRRGTEELHRTLSGYGTGLYSFLTKALVEEKELPALKVGISWFRRHHLRELARAIVRRPNHLSVGMVMAEIKGTLIAPVAYMRSARAERARRGRSVHHSGKGAA